MAIKLLHDDYSKDNSRASREAQAGKKAERAYPGDNWPNGQERTVKESPNMKEGFLSRRRLSSSSLLTPLR